MRVDRTTRPWISSLLVLGLLSGLSRGESARVADACDPGLVGKVQSAIGYQRREDRCEGIYAVQVNSSQLKLASLVVAFTGNLATAEELVVEWPTLPAQLGANLRVRAESLPARTYYRMDTVVPSAQGKFRWGTNLLAGLELSRPEDLGVVAWGLTSTPRGETEVYVPLQVHPGQKAAPGKSYEIAVVPSHRLEEVFVTLRPINDRGDPQGTPIWDRHPLEYGYYPAETATVFRTPDLETPGLYALEIAATQRGETAATHRLWLYHAGNF